MRLFCHALRVEKLGTGTPVFPPAETPADAPRTRHLVGATQILRGERLTACVYCNANGSMQPPLPVSSVLTGRAKSSLRKAKGSLQRVKGSKRLLQGERLTAQRARLTRRRPHSMVSEACC